MNPGAIRQLVKWAAGLVAAAVVVTAFTLSLRQTEPHLVINSQRRDDVVASRTEPVSAANQPAREPWKDVRVLCLVVTMTLYKKRAKAANDTWGQRCDTLVIMSNNGNRSQKILPIYKPNQVKEASPSAVSIMMALDYVRRNHADYDWFVVADDQTFVVMENLRYFVHRITSPGEVFFMHQTVKHPTKIGSPPLGFVLNKMALKAFGKFEFKRLCAPIGVQVTQAIERCMRLLKVDKEEDVPGVGHGRYYGFDLGWSLRGDNYNQWPPKLNMSQGDAEYVMFYHGIQDRKFYTLEFLLYQARLWGEKPNDSGEVT